MTTVVNTPGSSNGDNSASLLLGVLLILVIGVLFYIYGLPFLSRTAVAPTSVTNTNTTTTESSPAASPTSTSTTQPIIVPDDIDVTINPPADTDEPDSSPTNTSPASSPAPSAS
jgi:hypothetical protein